MVNPAEVGLAAATGRLAAAALVGGLIECALSRQRTIPSAHLSCCERRLFGLISVAGFHGFVSRRQCDQCRLRSGSGRLLRRRRRRVPLRRVDPETSGSHSGPHHGGFAVGRGGRRVGGRDRLLGRRGGGDRARGGRAPARAPVERDHTPHRDGARFGRPPGAGRGAGVDARSGDGHRRRSRPEDRRRPPRWRRPCDRVHRPGRSARRDGHQAHER